MRLAASYMTQAVAEAYIGSEEVKPDAVEEIFSWGYDPRCEAEEGSDAWRINSMFSGDDGVADAWIEIKEAHRQAVSLLKYQKRSLLRVAY